jgi:hypothetical protein
VGRRWAHLRRRAEVEESAAAVKLRLRSNVDEVGDCGDVRVEAVKELLCQPLISLTQLIIAVVAAPSGDGGPACRAHGEQRPYKGVVLAAPNLEQLLELVERLRLEPVRSLGELGDSRGGQRANGRR